MARVEIWEAVIDGSGRPVGGADVYVYNAGTLTQASVYAAESGGSPLSQPLSTANGAIPGWVEEGSYDLEISGAGITQTTRRFNALVGGNPALGPDSVDSPEIADDAVGPEHIQPDAVDTEHIADKAVESNQLADGAATARVTTNPAVIATRSTNFFIPHAADMSSGWTAVEWDSEVTDTGGCWTISTPSRFTAPEDGVYIVSGNVQISGTAGGLRVLGIRRNGQLDDFVSDTVQEGMANLPGNTVGNALSISEHVALEQGDYVELCVWQNSGGGRHVISDFAHHPYFGMTWNGPLST